jgi:hypothetical protein
MKSSRFHIADGQLVKTSNGEPIPDDEPVIIVRARDHLALPLMKIYRILALVDRCTDWFMNELNRDIAAFEEFKVRYPERMKQPGITMGK